MNGVLEERERILTEMNKLRKERENMGLWIGCQFYEELEKIIKGEI